MSLVILVLFFAFFIYRAYNSVMRITSKVCFYQDFLTTVSSSKELVNCVFYADVAECRMNGAELIIETKVSASYEAKNAKETKRTLTIIEGAPVRFVVAYESNPAREPFLQAVADHTRKEIKTAKGTTGLQISA